MTSVDLERAHEDAQDAVAREVAALASLDREAAGERNAQAAIERKIAAALEANESTTELRRLRRESLASLQDIQHERETRESRRLELVGAERAAFAACEQSIREGLRERAVPLGAELVGHAQALADAFAALDELRQRDRQEETLVREIDPDASRSLTSIQGAAGLDRGLFDRELWRDCEAFADAMRRFRAREIDRARKAAAEVVSAN